MVSLIFMGKNLVNKLFDKVRRGVLIAGAVASIGLASCDLCVTPPKPNYAPQILEFYANPNPVEVVHELGISKKVARMKPMVVVKG